MVSMIVVDSSVWIDFFTGHQTKEVAKFKELVSFGAPIKVADLVEIEVLQGFKSDKEFQSAKRLMDNFSKAETLLPSTVKTSINLHRDLRKKGVTIRKTIDTIIAAYCINTDSALLSSDKDFTRIANHTGLKLA